MSASWTWQMVHLKFFLQTEILIWVVTTSTMYWLTGWQKHSVKKMELI